MRNPSFITWNSSFLIENSSFLPQDSWVLLTASIAYILSPHPGRAFNYKYTQAEICQRHPWESHCGEASTTMGLFSAVERLVDLNNRCGENRPMNRQDCGVYLRRPLLAAPCSWTFLSKPSFWIPNFIIFISIVSWIVCSTIHQVTRPSQPWLCLQSAAPWTPEVPTKKSHIHVLVKFKKNIRPFLLKSSRFSS